MAQNIIEVKNLCKRYQKDILAVNNISFEVQEGEFFAFLGPNGAGKSTTINILCTTLGDFSGDVKINGHTLGKDNKQIQSYIGIVFQDSVLDARLSVKENLQSRAALYNIFGSSFSKRLDELTQRFDLGALLNRKYGRLSGGQRRRVDIARALIHEPKVLFLDEPTTGLDPQTRSMVWRALEEIKADTHMTLFLTTHYMEETNKADKVAIIDNGILSAIGSPSELKDKYSKDTIKLYYESQNLETLKQKLSANNISAEYKENLAYFSTKDSLSYLPLINSLASQLTGVEIIKGDMDNVFLNITGKKIRED